MINPMVVSRRDAFRARKWTYKLQCCWNPIGLLVGCLHSFVCSQVIRVHMGRARVVRFIGHPGRRHAISHGRRKLWAS